MKGLFVFVLKFILGIVACMGLALFARLVKKMCKSFKSKEVVDYVFLGIITTVISLVFIYFYVTNIMIWSKFFSAPISIFWKIGLFVIMQLIVSSVKWTLPEGYGPFFAIICIISGTLEVGHTERLYMKFSSIPLFLFYIVDYIPIACVIVSFFR